MSEWFLIFHIKSFESWKLKKRRQSKYCEMSLNSAKIFASRAIVSCHTSRNKNTSFKLFLYTQKLLCGNRNGLQLGCNFQWEKSYQTISSINLEKCNIIRSPCKELMLPDNVSLPEFVWEEGIKHHQDKLARTRKEMKTAKSLQSP